MPTYIDDKRILVGAMYAPFCRTQAAPMEEWDRDLANMAAAGYTVVHGFAEWHDIEYEKGKFDFTAIDHMVDCAYRHGLVPLINVATQNSVGFYSPRWLMEECRDKSEGFVDADGNRVQKGQFVVPCIDDPLYAHYAARYLAAVARHFAADTRVGGYVLWGEPQLFLPGKDQAHICYCEHTVKKFRRFLQERYGRIEALNAVWSSEGPSDFSDFDAVYPPTGATRQRGGYASWDDFRSFMEENLAGHIKEADRIFKENGAHQPTIVEMLTGYENGVDPWLLATCTDVVGMSYFERPGRATALYMSIADSMAKALDKSVFVVEATGASTKFTGRRSPTAKEVETTLLQRVAHGARGLMYWCWRPRMSDVEGGEFGMIRADGKLLSRTVELGRYAKELANRSDLFLSCTRRSDVAIFTSQYINRLKDFEDMAEPYGRAIEGACHLFGDLHINCDFVNDSGILSGRLQNYRLLVLPCSYILSEEVAEKITDFVRGGGHVMADYLLAEKRPKGFCYAELPGAGMRDLFGVIRDDTRVIEHPSLLHENGAGVRLGSTMELLEVTDATVLSYYADGEPLVTRKRHGQGSAVYFAGMMFSSYAKEPRLAERKTAADLLCDMGIRPYCTLERADLEKGESSVITTAMQDGQSGALRLVVLQNTGFGDVEDILHLPQDNWRVFPQNASATVRQEAGECRISFRLEAWESLMLYLE